ncbi:1-phosphofructokinase [Fusibacter bizertensis]
MVVTVTLNPAIDKTIEISDFEIGALNKVENSIQDPGGKGINVSKVIESLGGKSIATGFLGGSAGQYIQNALKKLQINSNFIEIQNETRTNLKIFDRLNSETTEVNEPGPYVSQDEVDALLEKVANLLGEKDILVISGSAPKSIAASIYKDLVLIGKNKGALVFLDASDEAFNEGIQSMPDYIKPNRHELERYFGYTITDDKALVEAGQHFLNLGIPHIFISLGKEGAFYCDKEGAYRLMPLKVEAHSSVGAGDAFVGAFVYALDHGLSLDEMLRLAVATSAGAVMTVGTKPMNVEWIMNQLDRINIVKC